MGTRKIERSAVVDEFADAALGDERRQRRLERIVERLAAKPDTGFPRCMATEADREGFYRFLANPAVTYEALLEPHMAATIDRVRGQGEVLALHDTTEFRFGGTREGLGRLTTSGHGFMGHIALAVAADGTREALGVLAVEPWVRAAETPTGLWRQGKISYDESRRRPSEQDRWARSVAKVEAAVGASANLIHVMDSEADDYALMCQLAADRRRWIIRLCYDRRLADDDAKHGKTRELVAKREIVCHRTVKLSRRRRQPGGKRRRSLARAERMATLGISAATVTFRRPECSEHCPKTLEVNIVAVRELRPPPEVEPVEWLLITHEPIESEEQILRVVDFYRDRWLIEEYFRALKSGCAFEKRQLESRDTLLKALALFIPIAWNLLRLRTFARRQPSPSARAVFTDIELTVLRRASERPLPRNPTVRDAMLALAALAGHRTSNGDPGWLLLGRGMQDLLMLVAGYRLALAQK